MDPDHDDIAPGGFLSTELANTVTHAVGFLASIAGLVILVVMASLRGSAVHIVSCSVYGATLAVLYLASTLYHASRGLRARKVFRAIDHAAIYLLIAGTYTPFALATLGGAWGWSVFGVAWGLALLGVIFEAAFCERYKVLSLALYIGMGWLCLLIIKPLLLHLSPAGVGWLLAGGVSYTVGTIFYVWKSLPHHHAIWHLFVMGGSTCHFFAVMFHVLPGP